MSDFVYLDYNATTPVDPRVANAMQPYLSEHYGNPSSSHALGRRSKEAVEKARAQVAAMLGCKPAEILFCSGGSEANNAALLGVAADAPEGKQHLITSSVEHPAIMEPADLLETAGWRVTYLPVDGLGLVSPATLADAIDSEVSLVSVMLANNEVGAIQPLAEIAAICSERGILLHTDAAQAVGKIPIDLAKLSVDFMTIAGHKFYAPKGIGALFIREGRDLPPFIVGAGQEGGRRAGTEAVTQIVGLGEAAAIVAESIESDIRHSGDARDRLLSGLRSVLPDDRLRINGPLTENPELCLPGTLSLSIRGLAASDLLAELGDHLAASAGAACNTDGTKVSATLSAMGLPIEWARGTLRLSVGRMTTDAEVDRAVGILGGAVNRLLARG